MAARSACIHVGIQTSFLLSTNGLLGADTFLGISDVNGTGLDVGLYGMLNVTHFK